MAERDGSASLPGLLPGYRPGTFDESYASQRSVWLDVFRRSTPEFARRAAADATVADARDKAAGFAARFDARLDAYAPGGAEESAVLSCLVLCKERDDLLRAAGFPDCFAKVKREENDKALAFLPGVLAGVDGIGPEGERLTEVIKGVFAGNLFDLGAAASQALYEEGKADFASARERLPRRPWVRDDLDAFASRLASGAYKKAVLFVDNAGADVVLGMIPLARELIRRGTDVVMAANAVPSINDCTASELKDLLAAVEDGALKDALSSGRLRVVSSGSDLPVIDLSKISPEVAKEVEDAELVVLEGMGRAIETNLALTLEGGRDALKLGMIKHPEVAAELGGELYGCVCKLN